MRRLAFAPPPRRRPPPVPEACAFKFAPRPCPSQGHLPDRRDHRPHPGLRRWLRGLHQVSVGAAWGRAAHRAGACWPRFKFVSVLAAVRPTPHRPTGPLNQRLCVPSSPSPSLPSAAAPLTLPAARPCWRLGSTRCVLMPFSFNFFPFKPTRSCLLLKTRHPAGPQRAATQWPCCLPREGRVFAQRAWPLRRLPAARP